MWELIVENVRNYKDIKLVRTNSRRNQLVSEIEMKKTNIKLNKAIYLGQLILDISKNLIYEFWYGYLKLKYGD